MGAIRVGPLRGRGRPALANWGGEWGGGSTFCSDDGMIYLVQIHNFGDGSEFGNGRPHPDEFPAIGPNGSTESLPTDGPLHFETPRFRDLSSGT